MKDLLHKAGFHRDGDAVHFAVNFVVSVDEADRLGLRAALEDLRGVLQLEESEEPDAKTIQRAKKKLLQEIDVNDGKVSWLNDYPLDKSRALGLEDELHDEKKRGYHWAIFRNKLLLRFLTHGDIGHFLYADNYFPRATLELLDKETELRAFKCRH